jgi:preprotein translocase subunit SecD
MIERRRNVTRGSYHRQVRLTPIVAALLAFATLTGCSAFDLEAAPQGWTKAVLLGVDPAGEPATADQLRKAEQTLSRRAQAAGLGKPSFVSAGDGRIEMLIPGRQPTDVVQALVAPGALRMRRVLDVAQPDPSTPATPQPARSAVAKGPLPTTDAVLAQLGEAATVAASLTGGPVTPDQARALAPFGELTAAQLAVLPPGMLLRVPQVGCDALNQRPSGYTDNPATQVVACDSAGIKRLLDVAGVVSADIAEAEALAENGAWTIRIGFTAAGQARFTALSEVAFNNSGTPPCSVDALSGGGSQCAIGIVSDNVVLSAPHVMGVLTGDASIGGDFTERSAKLLAAQLNSGTLPVVFAVESVNIAS